MILVNIVAGTTVVNVVDAVLSVPKAVVLAVENSLRVAVVANIFVGPTVTFTVEDAPVVLEAEVMQASLSPNALFHAVTAVSPYRPEYNQNASQHKFTTAGSAPHAALPNAVHMRDSMLAMSDDAEIDLKARSSDGMNVGVPCVRSYR